MANTYERVRSPERLHEAEAPDARLAPEALERLAIERKERLAWLRADIAPALHEALAAKLAYETACLRELAAGARAIEAKKRRSRVLKTEYFVQKPLDANLL